MKKGQTFTESPVEEKETIVGATEKDKEKLSEILEELDPTHFKYKM
jgi:hypothetical protein